MPSDFGQKKIIWTLAANGKTTVIPAHLHTDYEVSPFQEAAVGNTPPVLRFEEKGPSAQGPQGLSAERRTKVGDPLTLDRVGFRRCQVDYQLRGAAQGSRSSGDR